MRSNPGPNRRTGQRSFGTALVALVAAASLSTRGRRRLGRDPRLGSGPPRGSGSLRARDRPRRTTARCRASRRGRASSAGRSSASSRSSTASRRSCRAGAVPTLRLAPGVLSVTPDGHLQADGASYDPAADAGSMDATTSSLGVPRLVERRATPARGVDVAADRLRRLARSRGSTRPDKVVYGPDLSLESQAPNLTELDTTATARSWPA